jgi:hypothetical protein
MFIDSLLGREPHTRKEQKNNIPVRNIHTLGDLPPTRDNAIGIDLDIDWSSLIWFALNIMFIVLIVTHLYTVIKYIGQRTIRIVIGQ